MKSLTKDAAVVRAKTVKSPPDDQPGQRCAFLITLTKRAAVRLRRFVALYNVSAEDALASMASAQLHSLDDDESFELEMGRLAVAYHAPREATVRTEGRKGGAK